MNTNALYLFFHHVIYFVIHLIAQTCIELFMSKILRPFIYKQWTKIIISEDIARVKQEICSILMRPVINHQSHNAIQEAVCLSYHL